MRKIIIYIFLFVFTNHVMIAQNFLETHVDTTSIKIGDAFLLTLKATVNQGSIVYFPQSEEIGAFEVIENYPTDTIVKKNQLELIKKYTLTQFDSGNYQIPSLPVVIDHKQFKTSPLNISVLGVVIDTLKQPMYEIKSISKAGNGFDINWIYFILSILVIVLGIGLYFYIKKRQESNYTEDDFFKSPYEKASKKLQKLESKKNWIRGDAKSYYSEMTSIARSYIEETFDISAHELTTRQTISILYQTFLNKKLKIDKKVIEEFKKVLQTSDLVKFAKSQPQPFEITSDTEKIQKFLDEINSIYSISIETQTERIRLRQERQRRRMRSRIFIPIGVTTFLLLLIGAIYFFNNSQYSFYLKGLSFNNSKRLLNREWITSTYGSPGITISTPKVLTRRVDPIIQQNLPDGIKEAQQFQLESVFDHVQIMVNTVTLDKNARYNKDIILSHSISLIAQNFNATDVKYDKSNFENANGATGDKVRGSFRMEHPIKKKEIMIDFEMAILEKTNSLDEVCVFYVQEDAIGAEIAQKVLESIRYKKDLE